MQIYDSIIVGAGFFGLYLAEHLSKNFNQKVLVLEEGSAPMGRASYNNQARVHNGYHYPRNLLTASRSRKLFPRFADEFKKAIFDEFDKYYAIGTPLGKVSASQFVNFCKTIDIPLEPASLNFKKYFNPHLIEEVFLTKEYAFDSVILKELILERVSVADVNIKFHSKAVSVKSYTDSLILRDNNEAEYTSKNVFNCTYSQINDLLSHSKLPLIPLKHELTEICLVDPPEELTKVGLTVMCGPFFSVMPFPSEKVHSFSHVRYTPHGEFLESKNSYMSPYDFMKHCDVRTHWKKMIYDAKRYMPVLENCSYKKSIWEMKTVLPVNEENDGRPILYQSNYHLKGLHCILGGKIDNVYDMISVTDKILKV